MDQRLSFVTLAVADVAVSRSFYVDGLGWEASYDDDSVLMIQVGQHVVLSLWDRVEFEDELGPIAAYDGVPPFALAHNVPTPDDVDAVLTTAREAGAEMLGEPQERAWGGYTGYFADPDGFRWEVAHNPGPIGEKVLPT